MRQSDKNNHEPSAENVDRLEQSKVEVSTDLVKPKAQINLLGAITFAMGSMIGSGIFISPAGALESVGSVGMSLVVWSVSGMIAMVLGFIYGELGTLIPHSGGDYTYINKGLGAAPAFLAAWIHMLVGNPASFPILSLVFADYLLTPIFGNCGAPDSIRKTIAGLVIVTLAITNIISVSVAANIQILFTFAKVIALVIISIGGIVHISHGNIENIGTGFIGTSTNIGDYSLALYKCMFAYAGFQRANEIAEELTNSKRNIPRAVIFSILFVTFIYVTTNMSYCVVLSKEEIIASSAVAYDWAQNAIKPAAIIVPLSVMCSTYGALNGGGFTNGRIMFAAARNGHCPEVMSYLHVRTSIPVLSIITTHALGIILLILGDIGSLINFAGFMSFIIIGLTIVSLIRIRYKMTTRSRSFRTPLPVVFIGLLISLFMVVSPFVSSPKVEFLYGLAFLVVGVIVYIPLVHLQLSVPGFDRLTTLLQLILQVSPTVKVEMA